jgi:glycine/D-amino acid oxidase-like deaminating enzyme
VGTAQPNEPRGRGLPRLNPEIDETVLRNVVVVGAGVAGLAAAVYASSEGLDVLVLETTGRASRIELEDRELPRISNRHLGTGTRRTRLHPGREVRHAALRGSTADEHRTLSSWPTAGRCGRDR